jgi:hypothetical protein
VDSLDPDIKISIGERLGKLEGLLVGLQNAFNSHSQQTAQFLVRVERLEQRQLELERSVATVEDFRALAVKVDKLVAADARHEGQASLGRFALPALAQWTAVVVSILALIGVGLNRQVIQQHERNPVPPVTREP